MLTTLREYVNTIKNGVVKSSMSNLLDKIDLEPHPVRIRQIEGHYALELHILKLQGLDNYIFFNGVLDYPVALVYSPSKDFMAVAMPYSDDKNLVIYNQQRSHESTEHHILRWLSELVLEPNEVLSNELVQTAIHKTDLELFRYLIKRYDLKDVDNDETVDKYIFKYDNWELEYSKETGDILKCINHLPDENRYNVYYKTAENKDYVITNYVIRNSLIKAKENELEKSRT